MTSSACSRNVPVNGMTMLNAIVTSHASAAIASHSGNDQNSASASARGSRATANPLLKVWARPASRSATRCGRIRAALKTRRPIRSGCVASTHINTMSTTAAAPASADDTSIGAQQMRAAGVDGSDTPHT